MRLDLGIHGILPCRLPHYNKATDKRRLVYKNTWLKIEPQVTFTCVSNNMHVKQQFNVHELYSLLKE